MISNFKPKIESAINSIVTLLDGINTDGYFGVLNRLETITFTDLMT